MSKPDGGPATAVPASLTDEKTCARAAATSSSWRCASCRVVSRSSMSAPSEPERIAPSLTRSMRVPFGVSIMSLPTPFLLSSILNSVVGVSEPDCSKTSSDGFTSSKAAPERVARRTVPSGL
jgi:hypothetical protein